MIQERQSAVIKAKVDKQIATRLRIVGIKEERTVSQMVTEALAAWLATKNEGSPTRPPKPRRT